MLIHDGRICSFKYVMNQVAFQADEKSARRNSTEQSRPLQRKPRLQRHGVELATSSVKKVSSWMEINETIEESLIRIMN